MRDSKSYKGKLTNSPTVFKRRIEKGNSILGDKVINLLNEGYHQRYAISMSDLNKKPKGR